ncbi:SAM-dependent methyltransferase [Thermodesulfovibrio sp. 3907-1M]|uniref:SAM-dependent methyltransferase n=1 Tax=Thermodesulfovibrio autotrophicus TaxID=3118333 RepID=A0AAU8GTE8_9BACT
MLKEIIIEKIKKHGPIPFDEFMEMALYYPDVGYYTRADIKIGKEGDFFTASHLGSVFGFLLSKDVENIYQKLNCPQDFTVTELGPGMGYLAKDILDEVSIPLKYNLVEINPSLRDLQQQNLKQHFDKTHWVNSIDDLDPFTGVFICNEVFDALPVRVFEIDESKEVMEVYVDFKDDEFIETLLPCRKDTLQYIKEFAPGVLKIKGYRSEVNLKMKSLIDALSKKLQKGYLLIFDYGYNSQEYYHPDRKGTLLCYHKHTINENPYINIGRQDITAHVNFTALKKWAEEAGFNCEGYFSQSKYLISLCNEAVLKEIYQKNLIQLFKRVVLPQGMGESHKVIILSKNLDSHFR